MEKDKLFQKSELNLQAAALLTRNRFYASCVHCSYYAVFQLISYFVGKKYANEKEEYHAQKQWIHEQHKLRQEGKRKTQEIGSHMWYISEIIQLLQQHQTDPTPIYQDILKLKKVRIDADYRNKHITKNMAEAAYQKAESLICTLKSELGP